MEALTPGGASRRGFFTLVTGPRRSLSLKLRDTRVYEPQIRARLGTTAGEALTLDEVLMVGSAEGTTLGTPTIEGARVLTPSSSSLLSLQVLEGP